MTLGLPEAWNMFKLLTLHDMDYRMARFGVDIKFDINDYLKGRIITKPKSGSALLRGRSVNLESFETELEKREKIIKEFLIENMKDEDLFTPRGQNGFN